MSKWVEVIAYVEVIEHVERVYAVEVEDDQDEEDALQVVKEGVGHEVIRIAVEDCFLEDEEYTEEDIRESAHLEISLRDYADNYKEAE